MHPPLNSVEAPLTCYAEHKEHGGEWTRLLEEPKTALSFSNESGSDTSAVADRRLRSAKASIYAMRLLKFLNSFANSSANATRWYLRGASSKRFTDTRLVYAAHVERKSIC